MDKHFSSTYDEARKKFLDAAKRAGAEVTSHLVVPDTILFMDVAVLRAAAPVTEDPCGWVVHISGTHGVEGFAGSAIQTAYLSGLAGAAATTKLSCNLVFVHALNPYGMAHNRRWNENNVDLNRNALTEEGFRQVLNRDKNIAGYENLNSIVNPQQKPSTFYVKCGFYLNAIYCIMRYGFTSIKRALVAAQYHNPKGISYGGTELQKSHKLLKQALSDLGVFDPATSKWVTMIDVHTGLGKAGEETLMSGMPAGATPAEEQATIEAYNRVFPGRRFEWMGATTTGAKGAVSAGYELTVGTTQDFYPVMAPAGLRQRVVFALQEFGTISNVAVAKGLIVENMGHWFEDDKRKKEAWSAYSLAAFDTRTAVWRESVARKGLDLLRQALASDTAYKKAP